MSFISNKSAPSLQSAGRMLFLSVSVVFFLALSTSGAGGQTVEDDHGETFSSATPVELGSSVDGRIDPGDDHDAFKFDLSGASGPTDLWVYTFQEFDTIAGLYDSVGTLLIYNDDSYFLDSVRSSSIRKIVQPGIYYVIVSSYAAKPGDYTLYSQAVTAPGSTIETAKPLALDSHDGGTLDSLEDVDYFRLDFTESKHVIIDVTNSGFFPIDASLLDGEGEEISSNFRFIRLRSIAGIIPIGFQIAEDFEPGTYYLKVTNLFAPDPDEPETEESPPDEPSLEIRSVPYALFFSEDDDYTELINDCTAETGAMNNPSIEDPLYACQWYLNSPEWQHINVEPVWTDGIKGEGINVAIVDDGMYHAHEDLKDNVDVSLNFDYGGNEDIYGRVDHHGTHVAGMIAARDNDIGVRGVAPRATVYGYNILSGFNATGLNILDAMSRNGVVTAVSNNSWGPRDGPGLGRIFSLWKDYVKGGVTFGYEGKGIFYAFAAGNGHFLGDDSNLDELANNYAVTAVCSVHAPGNRAGYSELGANLWVCAPSNDRPGSLGGTLGILTTENSDRYFQDFGGTSAATPIVAGVAALTRDANPDLTWRDIKLILAASAQKNDPTSPGWEDGAPMHPISSSDRYHFNHEYGFGLVNAAGAVDLAKQWTSLPPLQETSESTGVLDIEIPDLPASGEPSTITHTLTVDTDIDFTEFVEVTVAFEHDSFRDLQIELESPSGAVSRLAVPFDTYDGLSFFLPIFFEGFVPLHGSYQLGSARHLGEDPNGEWKLHITDHISVVDGTFNGFAITVYGHERAPGAATLDSVVVHPGGGMLDVAWSAPDEAGESEITAYDIRYIPTDADETDPSNWTILQSVWSADAGGELKYTVAGLTDGTEYNVQVRAVNGAGGGIWTEALSATPRTSPCVIGEAVRDRTNSGLIHDCEALLEARDSLAGSATLNWSVDTRIWAWDGVIRQGDPLRVTKLNLRDRNLNGTIPAALGRLSSLVVLNLHSNMLSGSIPDISSMTSLEELYLANNELSGSIPESLGAMTNVRELWLWGNQLEGPIPDLSGMTGLTMLKLQDNRLTGGVPTWLGSMDSLRYLLLHNNPLGGEIPEELGQNNILQYLWLHSTGLTGEIPDELAGMAGLFDLNLRDNRLTGQIPEQLGSMSNLRWLRLHGNNLTGAIPMQLGNLSSLTHLWLADNELTGPIPSELGELGDTLTAWRLAQKRNTLTGCVPAGLAAVTDNDMAALGLSACP